MAPFEAAVTTETAPALIVRKRIAAPPEEVFPLWLDAASLERFMTPGGTKATVERLEPRVGGAFSITMRGENKVYPHRGVYKLIDPPHRLVFTWISDSTQQRETVVTVELARAGADATDLTLTHEGLPAGADVAHRGGWGAIVEILASRF